MKKKLLPLLILALGVLVFAGLRMTRPEPPAVTATERSWQVTVQPVVRQAQAPVLPLYGEVVAPDQQVVTATLAGRIARKSVRDGVQVARGQSLLALDEADIEPVLAQARAQVADLQAQVEAEQVRHDNDRKALVSERRIQDNARRQFERIRSLVDRQLASREALEQATDALARAELTVTNRERAVAEHPARLGSLKARLEQARASLATARLNSERARVVAPFDGVASDVRVAEGDQVSVGQTLFSLYPLKGLEVRARIPRMFENELRQALADGVRLQANTDDGRHRFVLERFAGESGPAGTEAVLSLAGEAHGLRPGALVTLNLARPVHEQAIEIPYSALYGAQNVYIMTDEGRMKRVTVERLGEARGENGERRLLIASEALKTGMSLITTHLPNAMTGLKVEAANAPGATGQ